MADKGFVVYGEGAAMFGFGKADKQRAALRSIGGDLRGALAAITVEDRAAVLLLGNCLLDLAARLHGTALADDPRAAPAKDAEAALEGLLSAREKLVQLLKTAGGAQQRAAALHLLAAELAALTVGLAIEAALVREVGACWKTVWDARAALKAAVVAVRRYERETGVEAVPRLASGQVPSDVDLLRAASKVPGFLRRKKV